MSTYQSGFAEINGATIFYEVKGEGRPVLLLHGFPLDSRMWDDQFEEFSNYYQVIRFDYAGCGKSSHHDEDYSLVEDAKNLLLYLGVVKVNLVGLSVGGNLAMDFTLTYPEMVNQLIVASSGLLGWTDYSPERQKYNKEVNELFQKESLEEAVELMCKAWVAGPLRSIDDIQPAIVEKYAAMLSANLTRVSGKGKMILPETKTIELVGNISVPTLIISPDIDFPDFSAISEFLHEKITDSQLVVIPGTAHMINMEKPLEFNQLVLEFLNIGR
ncbi:3-oxoadipate enol-lactonase [Bacillus sp. SLBN-46]|uniref:alpha/beta fold hydrolase n=1 Tax=Bacillus sp. SLBN-46 TaxID=3042283 RepID=UPI00285E7754|nr:alpha/beta hydrolase [Bacillus sp. SLBN-46]MDR6122022.1 3-oxoadipate enol-lactonase [Bacillus sp. SLBN-46]